MMMGLTKEKRLLFRLYKYVRFHFNFNLWCFLLMDFSAAFSLCHTQFSLFLICWYCFLVCCVCLRLTVCVCVCAFLFLFPFSSPFNLSVFFGRCLSVCVCKCVYICLCLELSDASVHHLISSVFAFMMNDIWAMRALQIRLTNHFMERNRKSLLFSRMKYLYYFMAILFYFLKSINNQRYAKWSKSVANKEHEEADSERITHNHGMAMGELATQRKKRNRQRERGNQRKIARNIHDRITNT